MVVSKNFIISFFNKCINSPQSLFPEGKECVCRLPWLRYEEAHIVPEYRGLPEKNVCIRVEKKNIPTLLRKCDFREFQGNFVFVKVMCLKPNFHKNEENQKNNNRLFFIEPYPRNSTQNEKFFTTIFFSLKILWQKSKFPPPFLKMFTLY